MGKRGAVERRRLALIMNVSLPPELESFVTQQVDKGLYHDVGEVVRAGLALLKERNALSVPPPTLAYVLEMLKTHEMALRALGIRHVSVFGSVARGEADARSDIDLAVDVDEGRRMGVIGFAGLIGAFEDIFTPYRVDVVERSRLKKHVREHYEQGAVRAF